MPLSSGQVVTADDLNHLKPTTYLARCDANLVGIVVDTDISGCSIPLTTETDNAVYVAELFIGADWQTPAAAGNVIQGKLSVDGSIQSGVAQMEQAAGTTGDTGTPGMVWRGTLATAGVHTLKAVASIPDADQRIVTPHTALAVTIYEVV